MHLNLTTLSHAPLIWSDSLPPEFKGLRLPGGKLTSALGTFGSICIQEFQGDQFTIRYTVLDILQKLVLRSKSKQDGIHTEIVLKGQAQHQVDNNLQWPIRQNQFSLLHALSPEITSVYNENIHISFHAFFSMTLVKELLPKFPALSKTIRQQAAPYIINNHPQWADADTFEIVYDILRCKYENELRQYYFKNRVRDLLIKYLVQMGNYDPAKKQPSEKEMEAVFEAERIINLDISKHNLVPDLSKKVLLNEFRFKAVFKMMLGMGPYEYLVRQRMKKAKPLLESGLSVKEVAALTGYRPSDFTTAFTNFYGITPSSVKKNNS